MSQNELGAVEIAGGINECQHLGPFLQGLLTMVVAHGGGEQKFAPIDMGLGCEGSTAVADIDIQLLQTLGIGCVALGQGDSDVGDELSWRSAIMDAVSIIMLRTSISILSPARALRRLL